jgi:hypothetical protein
MQIADEVLKWFSGLTAPVVAITVAYIGWQQYRINRDRARLDLYERRKAIHSMRLTEHVAVSLRFPPRDGR